MDKFVIEGGHSLTGKISVSGAKNAALPLMAATLVWPGKYRLSNVPSLKDTSTFGMVLETTGAIVSVENDVMMIDTTGCNNPEAPYELVKQMRASFYVLGPLLARFGRCRVSMPGGCNWGPRPVDLHLKVMEALGATIELEGGYIVATGKLRGGEYEFPISSVGATGNGMMAAVLAEGVTVLKNVAREPEIIALGEFLQAMGADIQGLGSSTLTITGVSDLNAADVAVIPDRIEAGTFLIGAAMAGENVTVTDVEPKHLESVIEHLRKSGTKIEVGETTITVSKADKIIPTNMTTAPYPGYPTDLQAQWMAMMTMAEGTSIVRDEVYLDRFSHIPELVRLGAKVTLKANEATVEGPTQLLAAPVMSTDIRASAAIVLATLVSEGTSDVNRIYHIDRGYDAIESKLRGIGASIKRVSE